MSGVWRWLDLRQCAEPFDKYDAGKKPLRDRHCGRDRLAIGEALREIVRGDGMSDAKPHFAMIGAGAMGGAVATLLADAGENVTLIDTDREIVRNVSQSGFRLEGAAGDHQVSVRVLAEPREDGWADTAIVLTTANDTQAAAETARRVLKPDGFVLTLQNGIGNVKTLTAVLGGERVTAGSIRSSAQKLAPGESDLTKLDPTVIGEIDGSLSDRMRALAATLDRAGFMVQAAENIVGTLWSKLIHNAAINPICASTGLVQAETAKIPELEALRTAIVEEALAVAKAKNIVLEIPDPLPKLRAHVAAKRTKPSMLQHVEAGRRTEIDAINGAIVREADALGIPVPANRGIVAVIKGIERRLAIGGSGE
jgi:2-dehydropantoate 2-reductase